MSWPKVLESVRGSAWTVVVVAAAALALACDVRTPTGIHVDPWWGWGAFDHLQVQMISGNGQVRAAGAELDDPFVVRIVDQNGQAVRGVTVVWTVIEGNGRLLRGGARYEIDSDESGLASATFALGSAPGRNVVAAGPAVNSWRVRFEATARAD